MSRCFPYPPPGFYRNGATYDALIESIKLQKETNKSKGDQKKEKKGKKEKEKSHKHKRTNVGSQKVLQNSSNCTEAQFKKTKAISELFEKSDLTEEHGQPISSQQPSYSSDSTQNSNKRKRDDYSLLADSSAGHGSFKIRFLKKPRGPDSSNFDADVKSNIHLHVPSTSTLDRSWVSSIEMNVSPATSGRQNRTQTNRNSTSERAKIGDSNGLHSSRVWPASGASKPILQSSRPLPQVLSRIQMENETERLSVSRNINDQRLHSVGQKQPTPSHHGMPYPVLDRTSSTAAGTRSINDISMPANDGLTKQKGDSQKVGPTRSEKKMLKKHAKYEKLIGSWLPPVFQAYRTDDDWLLSSSKTSNSSIAKGEAETCRESVASWQPCARFLAEVDIHALPYTVPF